MDAAEWISLLIVFLAVPGTLLLLVLLVLFLQKRVQEGLQPLQQRLKSFQGERRRLYAMIRDYSPRDREPYGSRVGMIAARLNQIDQQLGTLRRRYETLADEVDRQQVNSAQAIVGAPFLWAAWLRARREVLSIQTELEGLSEAFQVVKESLRQLNNLPWEAALQARRLKDEESQLMEMIDGMSQRSLHGKAFDTAVRQEKSLRTALSKIPEYFFTAEQGELLKKADKETVIGVFEILTSVQPDLEKQFEQVREWDSRYLDTTTRVNQARQLLGELKSVLESMPPGLDLRPVRARLKPLEEISTNLFSTLARLEVESLPAVSTEAERVGQAAKEMLDSLRQARRHEAALTRVMDELNSGQKDLSARFTALARSPVHPVQWNLSREGLADLSRQIAALEAPENGRELESVGANLNRANALAARQKELARHLEQAAGQHAELLQLLDSPEIKDAAAWSQTALDFASKVTAYDPENWPRADSAASLARDLREVIERRQRIVPPDPSSPILETELKNKLEEVRALQEQTAALRSRLEKIRLRFTEIQAVEKSARDRLQEGRMALSQIDLLVRGIDILNSSAGPEVDRLRGELEGLSTDLGQRSKGLVEAKAKAVNELAARLETAANGWIDRLNADIAQKKRAIASALGTLDEIASLEERAITHGRELLAQDAQTTTSGRGRQKSAFRLEELVGAMKPRADYWQACLASIRELGDLENQVVEAFQSAAQRYQEMKEQMALASQYAPEKRSWPPTSLSLSTEAQEFSRIESLWEALETQSGRAIWVVRLLGDIAGKCQVLAERCRQIAQRAAQEQERVENLEDELDGLFRQWQEQAQLYPEAAGQIRKLKAQTEGEVTGLQRSYVQGQISYHDVLQGLSKIYRNLQSARIPLNDGQFLSLEGESGLGGWRF